MTPDTVISLTTGHKFMVLESADVVVEKIVSFRRSLNSAFPTSSGEVAPELESTPLTHGR